MSTERKGCLSLESGLKIALSTLVIGGIFYLDQRSPLRRINPYRVVDNLLREITGQENKTALIFMGTIIVDKGLEVWRMPEIEYGKSLLFDQGEHPKFTVENPVIVRGRSIKRPFDSSREFIPGTNIYSDEAWFIFKLDDGRIVYVPFSLPVREGNTRFATVIDGGFRLEKEGFNIPGTKVEVAK